MTDPFPFDGNASPACWDATLAEGRGVAALLHSLGEHAEAAQLEREIAEAAMHMSRLEWVRRWKERTTMARAVSSVSGRRRR